MERGQDTRDRRDPNQAAANAPNPSREPPILAEPVDDPPTFFQPREFAGGRVRVYGCSPGCLIVSLLVSVILSLLLTALVNAL